MGFMFHPGQVEPVRAVTPERKRVMVVDLGKKIAESVWRDKPDGPLERVSIYLGSVITFSRINPMK